LASPRLLRTAGLMTREKEEDMVKVVVIVVLMVRSKK
jgi:hypothetical protein